MPRDPALAKNGRTDAAIGASRSERTVRIGAIAELDRVTLLRDVQGDEGEIVPVGATGTVVGIWAAGSAFEVEFSEPVSALATVKVDAIAAYLPR